MYWAKIWKYINDLNQVNVTLRNHCRTEIKNQRNLASHLLSWKGRNLTWSDWTMNNYPELIFISPWQQSTCFMTWTLSNSQSLSLKSVQSDFKFNYYLNKKPDNQYWNLWENNEEIIMSVYNDYWHQHWGNLCMTIIFNGLYPQIHCTYLPFHFIHTIRSPRLLPRTLSF